MTPKTRRLPKTLKKKLEASLKHLTPREAGRLHLIYLQESAKSNEDGFPAEAYPPITELEEALAAQIDEARKKGHDEYARAGARANGYHFLAGLVMMANDWAEREFFRIAYLATASSSFITRQIKKMESARVAWEIDNKLSNELPYPVTHEDYDRLLHWAAEESHWSVWNVAEAEAEAWAKAQGAINIGPEAVIKMIGEPGRSHLKRIVAENEEKGDEAVGLAFRTFLANVSEDVLTEKFFGDREALKSWVETGGWAGGGLTQEDVDKRIEALEARLIAMIEAGELEGGEAVGLGDCFDSVLIDKDGLIPAWAALRSLWRLWLIDHDFLIRQSMKITPDSLRGVLTAYTADGDLEGEDLVNVVAEFLADCREKPWGVGIAGDVDLAQLGRFLSEAATPLTAAAGEALGLGRVNLQQFNEDEGEDPFDREDSFWVTTSGSLRKKIADLGLTPDMIDSTYLVKKRYYVSDNPREAREDLARIFRMISQIGTNKRPAFEENIQRLGEAFGAAATVRLIFESISDEYFDGLPVLLPYNEGRLASVETILTADFDQLDGAIQALALDPWNIETSALTLVKDPADEELAAKRIDTIVKLTLRISGLDNAPIDLGDGEDPRKPKPRPASKVLKKPAAVTVAAGEEEAEE